MRAGMMRGMYSDADPDRYPIRSPVVENCGLSCAVIRGCVPCIQVISLPIWIMSPMISSRKVDLQGTATDSVVEAQLPEKRPSWHRPVVSRIDVGRMTLTKCTSNCCG